MFAPVIEAATAAGLRCGWLELGAVAVDPPPVLAGTAALGLVRAVAVGPGITIAVKPRRGGPVLRDLLREHFLGCAVVLVRGGAPLPALSPAGESWRLDLPGGQSQVLGLEELVARLRKPRPFS